MTFRPPRPTIWRLGAIGLGASLRSEDAGRTQCSIPPARRRPGSPRSGWTLFTVATVVTIGVFVFLAFGLVRRRRSDDEGPQSEREGERWVIGGGVILPIVVLLPIVGFGLAVLNMHTTPTMQIEVIGHQFWWEYRYLGEDVQTANELHIPVDKPVELVLTSDDVNHSFWVPSLGRQDRPDPRPRTP